MGVQGVHFRGIGPTVDAYEKNAIVPWAVVSQKELLFACPADLYDDPDGAESELSNVLQMLQAGGSEGVFSLQVYKIDAGKDILSTTPFYRSFRFSLAEYGAMSPYNLQRSTFATEVKDKVDRLEEMMLELMEERKKEPETRSGIGSVLNGIIQNPDFQMAMIGKAASWLGIPLPTQPARVAGLENKGTGESVLNPEQVKKVQDALDILCRLDAKLGDHLMGIAKIARDDPGKYNMLSKML
jgi:hypothetical protein